MAEVVLEEASKRFDAVNAVDSLSLTIGDGELLVLLGPTGAGKTTTLRLVAGLEIADTGRVLIGGQDVSTAPIAERDVAFVFQQYSLYPHYSVYDNLAFPLRSPKHRHSEREIANRVNEIAKLLRIDTKLSNKATALSGGEMQRVAIGRSLVRTPNVFLMDEPLSSLDAKLREDLRVELKRIQVDLGATILYVTHDQMEAMTLADRIGVLDSGSLVQVGTPEEIYTRPVNVHVAQRLGAPPINLLPPETLDIPAPKDAVRIGIRPEDIHLGGEGVTAEVVQVEYLGAETVVVLSTESHRLHALASPGEHLLTGDRLKVSPLPDKALFFDADGMCMENP